MPEPLDYRNPRHRTGEIAREPAAAVAAAIPIAIPAEFEVCIARTDDHAAIRAIEVALAANKIEFFLGGERERAARVVSLHVRLSDADRSLDIAGTIFARRAKFRSHPKTTPVQLPDATRISGGFWP